jgi:hypothetical protein
MASTTVVHALPSARFDSLGELLRHRQRERAAAPIEYESSPHGLWHRATGTLEQLVAAGLMAREHLPEGRTRSRHISTPDGHSWAVRLKGRGRVELMFWPDHPERQKQDADTFWAEHEFKTLPTDSEEYREQVLSDLDFNHDLASICRERGGFSFSDEDWREIEALQRQVEAAFARVEAIVCAAQVDFIQSRQDAAVKELRAKIEAARGRMLPLPPLKKRAD